MNEKNESFFDRAGQWMKTSITLRLLTIGFLILLMLIPVSMITDLIREREWRQMEAIAEVSSKWGEAQTLTGPVISVPYMHYSTRKYAHFLPGDLKINGQITPKKRKRGIFEVIVYSSDLTLEGHFDRPDFSKWKIQADKILWDEATINLGFSDLRSLRNTVSMDINGEELKFDPGVETQDVMQTGVSARLQNLSPDSASGPIRFKTNLVFNGSSSIHFIPIGKTNKVNLTSDWKDPKFSGAFLPGEHNITKDGFQADWYVLHLNRSYPQQFLGAVNGLAESAFGVDLIVPVDEYQKSMRSAKYAVLFITLTFMIFFFAQILGGVRVHPLQYILVGLALCVFYTLLIAISEHLNFALSYLIASVAIISLITWYVNRIFRNRKITMVICSMLVLLYLFIFSILQLEDFALLMGSIGLFLVLAAAMVLSSRIDWYAVRKPKEDSDTSQE